MSKGRLVGIHGLVFLAIGGVLVLYAYLNLGCLFRMITGIPCPTCGMTRSLNLLLMGDFGGYLRYHPLAIPLLIAALLGIHRHSLPRWERGIWWILVVVGLVTILFYLYRLFHGLIP